MTADLREYISKLKKSKEIKIIKKKVSTKFEIAGITAKADGTSALLFENIKLTFADEVLFFLSKRCLP